jgi:predicted O-linked N-acetylglucosamine transferase (SPINDLY family)
MKNFNEIIAELLSLLKLKNYKQAEKKTYQLLKIFINNNLLFNILGISQTEQLKFIEAEKNFKEGLKFHPEDFSLNNNLGNLYSRLGEHEKAVHYYEMAVKSGNVSAQILNNLGNAQKKIGLFLDSLKSYKKAINLNKNLIESYLNCSSLLTSLGKVSLSLRFLKRAIEISKYDYKIYSKYVGTLLYKNSLDNKIFKSELDNFKNLLKQNITQRTSNFKPRLPRVRLGFVSSDFKNHPVGYFLHDLLILIKNDFDIYAYYNNKIEDNLTIRFKPLFNKWSVITDINDEESSELIKKDKIDILFDLSGHTAGNRLGLFMKKPARVQISWAGFLMSTGLKEIDYIIVDPFVVDKKDKIFFSEKFLIMRNIWCCYSTGDFFKIKPQKLPALNNQYITFGSFNNLRKVTSEVIAVWSQILKKIPNSKLLLKTEMLNYKFIQQRILSKFIMYGVSKDQLILEGSSSRERLLESYNKIDIALDTFPYNGGTTSFELSKMTVPLLTKKGDSFVSRCGFSINKNLSMDDWIANNNNDYISKAIKFSKDINYLLKVKKNLAAKIDMSPLFDINTFYKDFKNNLFSII